MALVQVKPIEQFSPQQRFIDVAGNRNIRKPAQGLPALRYQIRDQHMEQAVYCVPCYARTQRRSFHAKKWTRPIGMFYQRMASACSTSRE